MPLQAVPTPETSVVTTLPDVLPKPDQSVVTTPEASVVTTQNLCKPIITTLEKSVVTTLQNGVPVPNQSVVTTPDLCKPIVTTPEKSVVTTLMPPTISMPSSALEASRMPESVRRTAEERLLFLAKVDEIKMEEPKLTDPLAVIQAAIRWKECFSILQSSGQRGTSQLTYENYRNWKRRVRGLPMEACLTALADQYKRGWTDPRADKYNEFYTLFNRIWLHANRQKITESYRNTRDTLQRVNPTAAIPSLPAVRYYIKHLPKEVIIHECEGEVAWRNRCCDYAERDWSMIDPGYLVVGDSRPFDTWVRVRTSDGGWAAKRPVLSGLMDARSWYMVSWMITRDSVKTDDQIKLMAQYCCATGGHPPVEAYFDNGKDYVAAGYSTPMALAGQDYSIFAALGIRLTRANPYNGRAKTIESNFKNVMQRFDKKFPAYLGSNPMERPDAADYHEKHPEELPDLGTFCRIFADWLGAYQKDAKEGTIHEGRSPEEVWAGRRMQSRRRTMDELREAFMRPYGVREIGRGGRISVEGKYYFTDNVRWGEKVIVKTDPFHQDRIGVYDLNGARIGNGYLREAVAALVHGDEYEIAKLEDRMARQKAQEREVKRLALELKGGQQNASPIEEMLTAGTGVRLIKRGEIHTVKGKNHTYKRLAPADPVFPIADAAGDEAQAPEEKPAKPTRKTGNASTVEAFLAEENTKTEKPKRDLTGVYEFLHNQKPKQGDQDYDNW